MEQENKKVLGDEVQKKVVGGGIFGTVYQMECSKCGKTAWWNVPCYNETCPGCSEPGAFNHNGKAI